MLKKRIIPCLDVRENQVVKGIQFRNHEVIGDILNLAKQYCLECADELVFYDITASVNKRLTDKTWVGEIAKLIDIPFFWPPCVHEPEPPDILCNRHAI